MISSVASGAAKSQFAPPAAAAQRGAQYRSNAAAAVVECVSASAAAAAYAEASDHSQPVAAEPGGVSASLHTASAFATPVICTHQLHALRTPAEHASAGMRCTGMCVHVQKCVRATESRRARAVLRATAGHKAGARGVGGRRQRVARGACTYGRVWARRSVELTRMPELAWTLAEILRLQRRA